MINDGVPQPAIVLGISGYAFLIKSSIRPSKSPRLTLLHPIITTENQMKWSTWTKLLLLAFPSSNASQVEALSSLTKIQSLLHS